MTQPIQAGEKTAEQIAEYYCDEAKAHLQIRSPINRAIYAALYDYRMTNMVDEFGDGYPLLDLMSNPAPADVSTGGMQMIALADEIETAVRAILTGAA